MAQRLMIARALMHSPSVLFLDEPTNNLDPQSRLFLWDRIRALNQQGLTILLTTHDMDEADRLCERVAIMDQGKILVNNTPAELKKMIPGGNALEIRVKIPDTGDTQRPRASARFAANAPRRQQSRKVEQVENNAPNAKPVSDRPPVLGPNSLQPRPRLPKRNRRGYI